MLTKEDIQMIDSLRDEMKANRTTPVTIVREIVQGKDRYTNEPITTTITETVQALVKGFTGKVGGERLIVNGVAIEDGDINIKFDAEVNLEGVEVITVDAVDYAIVNVLPRGIGSTNRYEVIARRVK